MLGQPSCGGGSVELGVVGGQSRRRRRQQSSAGGRAAAGPWCATSGVVSDPSSMRCVARPFYVRPTSRGCGPLEFEAGDHVYLRVSPTRGVKRFGIKGKLVLCYISPFLILARLGNVAYHLELPPILAGVHNVFHVFQLMKYLSPPVDVVVDDVSPLDADLSYPEHLVKILGQ
jgi:hypothetical protein